MKLSAYDKILEEFQKSNFQKSYDLAVNLNNTELNDKILKILTISSFNLQKYSDEDGHTIARTGFVLKESTTK